ncbi:hypothetical protein BDF19DRAFT_456664 [Syncephalis fuscata]|nr:hypothetical protein BDF19DRAFT_456664 [Syncephalis fuscata]
MSDPNVASDQHILQTSPTVSSEVSDTPGTLETTSTISPSMKKRFRSAARRVIHAQTLARQARYAWKWQPGSDPGVDVRRFEAEVQENSLANCKITVVDYSKDKLEVSPTLNNDTFEAFLQKPRADWSKVRWINVEGLSFDVIRTFALEFDLHPLAVEDILHIPQRTKVDRYASSLYISIILHAISLIWRQKSLRIVAPKEFEVTVEQASLFLLPDCKFTVLTFFQHEGELVCQPIFKRIQGEGTILRSSEDASLLVQAVLDAAVDHALIVVNAYRDELLALETNVIRRPRARLAKDLHLLTGELNQFKRTFMPTLALIRNLRENAALTTEKWQISNLARIYLNDVLDHCTVINDDLTNLISMADSLINLIFNLVASQTNDIMFVLSLVSCVFLPVTFIAGVYGTNFEVFPELKYSDGILYFWKLCGIVTALVVVIFAFGFYMVNRQTHRYRPGTEMARQLQNHRR